MYSEFGRLLHKYREEQKLSLEQLIKKLDEAGCEIWNKSTISRWEHGKNRPASPEIVKKLEDILNLRRGLLLKPAGYYIVLPDNELGIKDKPPLLFEEQRLDWIEAHIAKTGKCPILEEPLDKSVENYIPGTPIHRELKPKVISQATIKEYKQIGDLYNQWRELVKWLGYNPDKLEYLGRAQSPPGGISTGLIPKRKLI